MVREETLCFERNRFKISKIIPETVHPPWGGALFNFLKASQKGKRKVINRESPLVVGCSDKVNKESPFPTGGKNGGRKEKIECWS